MGSAEEIPQFTYLLTAWYVRVVLRVQRHTLPASPGPVLVASDRHTDPLHS
jgi:hypothetical protein